MKKLKEKIDIQTTTKGEYKNYMWNKSFARRCKVELRNSGIWNQKNSK